LAFALSCGSGGVGGGVGRLPPLERSLLERKIKRGACAGAVAALQLWWALTHKISRSLARSALGSTL